MCMALISSFISENFNIDTGLFNQPIHLREKCHLFNKPALYAKLIKLKRCRGAPIINILLIYLPLQNCRQLRLVFEIPA